MENKTTPFQNYLHNRSFDPAACTEQRGKSRCTAVDENGFIVDQKLLSDFQMSRVAAGQFGCGWVACYNALRLLGRPQSAARTVRELEHAFVLGGYMGTHAAAIAPFFTQKGFQVKISATPKQARQTAPAAKANIVFFIRGPRRGAHFVAFAKENEAADGEPVYRFYNSQSVPEGWRRPPAGEHGHFICAGGSAGDLRTLPALLAAERPAFWMVFSIN